MILNRIIKNNIMCMKNVDTQYFDLVRKILKDGKLKKDRTGTGTISIFDHTMRMNMDDGFPLLTSKKMFIKGIIYELIWFLNGGTNIKYLVDNDVHIWDGDAYKKFTLCKSSFVLSPVAVWQFVLSAFLWVQFLLYLLGFSASILAGVQFTIAIVGLVFSVLVHLAGIFIVRHQVAVGYLHCPFRGFA